MATHTLEPERDSIHGCFSKDLKPALTIDPGDTVQIRALDADWNLEPLKAPGPGGAVKKVEPREKGRDGGHCLTGPIEIRGAEPGMNLAVTIDDIRLGSWGQSSGGGGGRDLNIRLHVNGGDSAYHLWELDPDTLVGRNQHGHTIKLNPFMGVMGMPTDEPGVHATWPPRVTGGNFDCKELVPGSTLYLPIQVPGGLFSVGDGHATQGDGEVSGVSIECPMERVTLTFSLNTYPDLDTPRARVPGGWLTFGLHRDLNEAAIIATNAMLDLMCGEYNLDRKDAINLASLVVDLRVTQIVNMTKGVHAFLPDGAIGGV